MNTFWHLWVFILTTAFFVLMFYVIFKYWRSNKTANEEKVLDTFDNIEERDAPAPKFLFTAYFIAFVMSIIYLVLYPGYGDWSGLLDWKQSDDKLSSPVTTLDKQMSRLATIRWST